jgi:hypothetical protein
MGQASLFLGISSFFGTKKEFPFFYNGKLDVLSAHKSYNFSESDFEVFLHSFFSCCDPSITKSVVGIFVVRRSSLLSPSLRDVETLMALSSLKETPHPLVVLMISVPLNDTPSWIYPMEYQCFSLHDHHSPVIEQIDLHIPSLSADISADYRSVESLIPSKNLRHEKAPLSDALQLYSKNVLCDTILATVNTELLAEQYLTEIKVPPLPCLSLPLLSESQALSLLSD